MLKEFWSYTYLFNDNINKLEIQKNKRQIDIIIKNSIEEVVRKLLPLKTILKDYLETNLDTDANDESQVNNSLVDIIKDTINQQKDKIDEKTKTNKPIHLKKILLKIKILINVMMIIQK